MFKKALFIIIIALILLLIASGFLYLLRERRDFKWMIVSVDKLFDRVDKLEKKSIFSFYWILEEISLCDEQVPFEREYVQERLIESLIIETEKSLDMKLIFLRSGRWFPVIERELNKAELPLDLKYLFVIESNLNHRANSERGARGISQFDRRTGRQYGLRVDWWIDERYDPFKSIEAAIKHLKDLYDEFGNWPSALAGYNMHKDKYGKQFKKQEARDFYEVRNIPWQTQRFIFRMIATKLIMERPERYGYETWQLINLKKYRPWQVERIKLVVKGSRKNRKSIVEILKELKEKYQELSYPKFVDYNPHILRDSLPPGTYQIYIPEEAK